jgi:dolichol-phosphate mannosyltransferase
VKKLSIIVPVFNEEKTVSHVLQTLKKLKIPGWISEIIVINDGSKDNTPNLLDDFKKYTNFKIIAHSINKGKGYAIRNGLKKASGDILVIQDADLEYNPSEIKKLILAYERKGGLILGSRNLKSKRKGYPHYVFGVWLLTTVTNLMFTTSLTDLYTCYKVISLSDAKSLKLKSEGFEIEMEIVTKSLKKGLTVAEVPISYNPRSFSEGKKINWHDGLKGLKTLLKIKFFNL